MKPRNFPARKKLRRLVAAKLLPEFDERVLAAARSERSKKDRTSRAKIGRNS